MVHGVTICWGSGFGGHQSHEICHVKIGKTMMKSYDRDGTCEIVLDVTIASSETLPKGVSH